MIIHAIAKAVVKETVKRAAETFCMKLLEVAATEIATKAVEATCRKMEKNPNDKD